MLSYRPIKIEDTEYVLGLYRNETKWMYAPPDSPDDILRWLTRVKRYVYLFEGQRAGTFAIDPHLPSATFGLIVDPAFRGRGISAVAMQLLEAEAKKLGVRVLCADVFTDNAPAMHLFKKAGLRDFVWMEKNLT